jgi:uncharacterized membrane protein YdjX (TVP38/TMEM64 family)
MGLFRTLPRERKFRPEFLSAIILGCIPTLFLLCAIGNTLLMGNYRKGILLGVLLVVGVLLLYLFRKKLFALSETVQTAWEQKRNQRASRP